MFFELTTMVLGHYIASPKVKVSNFVHFSLKTRRMILSVQKDQFIHVPHYVFSFL